MSSDPTRAAATDDLADANAQPVCQEPGTRGKAQEADADDVQAAGGDASAPPADKSARLAISGDGLAADPKSKIQNPKSTECICVRGARVHNLKNIDLDIPRDRLVVITGKSGSGKSSLAFDTIFAEGQRQFIEGLSAYARQFLHQLERPDVDLIEGLQPTVSVDQRAGSQNPRSTVATVTEIYDHLRLLVARVGEATCYQCGAPIRKQSPDEIEADLASLPANSKLIVLAPLIRGRKGQHQETFDQIRKAGFIRARVDGVVYDLDSLPKLESRKNHTIEAVVDRLILRDGAVARLAESVHLAVEQSGGLVGVAWLDPADREADRWQDRLYSTEYACARCKISYEEIEPRTFSFNSPYGACPACQGLGSLAAFDPELVVPDRSLSLAKSAVAVTRVLPKLAERLKREVAEFAMKSGFRWTTPLAELSPKTFQALLYGQGANFDGIIGLLERLYQEAPTDSIRERLETFRGAIVCRDCGGARLRREARNVRVAGRAIHEITALVIDEARGFFETLAMPELKALIARPIVREIDVRLEFLTKVGLGYLALDRAADTLSGGELQRVRLASSVGSGLVGVCYVLDEPSIGLHPRDNARLIETLRELQASGNSVLVVEHDEAIMRSADYLIDLGPGAGEHGGHVVAAGAPDVVIASAASITGRYLARELAIEVPAERRQANARKAITIEGAQTNNLKDVTAVFPLGVLTCVTGVSGSGKSSLVNETLSRAVARKLTGDGPKPGPYASLKGVQQIDKLVVVDQAAIGRTPRSNPATYTGIFDEIRRVYAETREAKLRGYKTGRFSFNVRGGRCEECQGQGLKKIEMNFLPDLYATCSACGGARFNAATLEVRFRGRSIAEVLDMPVEEALPFFDSFVTIRRVLECLDQVGLGYLRLGQSCTTLSGGEAQRIKLAAELARVDTGRTLYVLDEPTTGLHFDDTRRLIEVLRRLVELRNTVVVIEHNIDVMKSADWIIDLGPEGGAAGGRLLFAGAPEEIAELQNNATGRFLREALSLDAAAKA